MRVWISVTIAVIIVSKGTAATIYMESAGASFVQLAPGDSAEISIKITLRNIDSGFAFANLFLDEAGSSGEEIEVTSLEQGLADPPDPDDLVVYDRSSFTLPAKLSSNPNNEYGLIMGSPDRDGDGGSWTPLGADGTYVLDVITVTHNGTSTKGTVNIFFEGSARQPQLFTENFTLLTWDSGLDGQVSEQLDPGVGSEGNPFRIDFIPKPANGDSDGDQDVDLADFNALGGCFAGPDSPSGTISVPCLGAFDFDGNQNIDLFDVALFMRTFTGPLEVTP